MSLEELKEAVLGLSPEARAYLARELLAGLDAMSKAETGKLWIEEARRRDEELDSGRAGTCPADEVLARARARRK